MTNFRYLGTTVTNQKFIHKEIKSRLISQNVCYHILHGTIILPLVMHGCDHILSLSENRMLRRIFGPKRDEETEGWRKSHNEELHNLFFSSYIIRIIKSRRMRWMKHVACMGEMRNLCRISVTSPEGKRSLGRPRHR
jgi:hypothetical protein